MAETSRIFHFVFGLREQTEPFHLAHYLCLESCRRVNGPAQIQMHYRHLPYGPWWDRIAPHLTLCRVTHAPAGFDTTHYRRTQEGSVIEGAGLTYAHEADFIRQDVLIAHGGVYADIDTLFVRPYPASYYRHECLLGEEPPIVWRNGILRPSLCNAVIFAQPGSRFMRQWRKVSAEVFDGSWSRHSCQAASELWYAGTEALHIAPRRSFYRFGLDRSSFASLFDEVGADLRGVCSIHLWAHLWWSEQRTDLSDFHAGRLTEAYVRTANTTYANLARPFLT